MVVPRILWYKSRYSHSKRESDETGLFRAIRPLQQRASIVTATLYRPWEVLNQIQEYYWAAELTWPYPALAVCLCHGNLSQKSTKSIRSLENRYAYTIADSLSLSLHGRNGDFEIYAKRPIPTVVWRGVRIKKLAEASSGEVNPSVSLVLRAEDRLRLPRGVSLADLHHTKSLDWACWR